MIIGLFGANSDGVQLQMRVAPNFLWRRLGSQLAKLSTS